MKRTLSIALCVVLLAGLGFVSNAQNSRKSQSAQRVLGTQQLFGRHLLPSEPSVEDVAASQKLATALLLNSPNAPNSPNLMPNDPGFLSDPNKGTQIRLPEGLGDIAQMRSQGLDATWRPSYVIILDGGGISHPQLDPNRLMSEDRDFTAGGTVTDNHAAGVNSIMASKTNDATGSYGLADTGLVKIIHYRIFDNNGGTTLSDETDAIDAIVARKNSGLPIDAVVCAYGGSGKILLEEDAFRRLTNAGIVVFAGAGNPTTGVAHDFFPAGYADTNPRIIPVAALNTAGTGLDQVWSWGAIAAPTNVRVSVNPTNPNGFGTFGGVSAATGQPAAVFALVRSVHPELSVDDALHRLLASCGPLPGLTFGKLDMFTAVTWQPLLVSQSGAPTDAAALDAVTNSSSPFSVKTAYYTEHMALTQTRLAFFSYNVDPAQLSNITFALANAPCGALNNTVSAESAMKIPGNLWLTQITVRLPDCLAGAGNVSFTLKYRNQQSDPLGITMR